jgi:uncharacterized protein (TIGR03435 family)
MRTRRGLRELCRSIGVLLAFHLMSAPLPAQQFEAASIKLNPGCDTRPRRNQVPLPGRLTFECTTLATAIQNAYGIWADGHSPNPVLTQVIGGPCWIDSDFYEIIATVDGDLPLGQINGRMFRALLEERFKLKIHRETKAAPIYALTVAKSGFKLKPTAPGDCSPPSCGFPVPGMKGRNVTMNGKGITMKNLAEGLLSRMVDRKVIDKTGVDGVYDFHLEFTPDDATPLGAPQGFSPSSEPGGLSIFTALEQQLGLTLKSERGAINVLVIDSVERPSEN